MTTTHEHHPFAAATSEAAGVQSHAVFLAPAHSSRLDAGDGHTRTRGTLHLQPGAARRNRTGHRRQPRRLQLLHGPALRPRRGIRAAAHMRRHAPELGQGACGGQAGCVVGPPRRGPARHACQVRGAADGLRQARRCGRWRQLACSGFPSSGSTTRRSTTSDSSRSMWRATSYPCSEAARSLLGNDHPVMLVEIEQRHLGWRTTRRRGRQICRRS